MWSVKAHPKSIFLLLLITNLTVEMNGIHIITKRQAQCDPNCMTEINSVNDYVGTLHQQQTAEHDKMLQRLIKLENQVKNSGNLQTINQRLNRLESDLRGNITLLENLVNYDMKLLYDNLHHDVDLVKKDLNNRMKNVTSEIAKLKKNQQVDHNNHANHNEVQTVYNTVTKRINELENSKIYNLTQDNHIWRSNFRAINQTFERVKRNGNCACK